MSLDQPQIGVQLVYDEPSQSWTLSSTGAEIAPELIHAEIRSHALLTSTTFDTITAQMYAGEVALDVWQSSMLAELKDGHIANAMFANGGSELSAEALARVQATIDKESKYLAQFAQGVRDGDVSVLQARARAKQYSNAMEQSYWKEWDVGLADTAEYAHLPLTQNWPGDGQTECRGNCACTKEFVPGVGIIWSLNPADHCNDCPALAAGSPYRSI